MRDPGTGPARFYGGEEALRVLVQDTVVEAGHDCGSGIADGLFAAELAARAGDGGVVVPDGGAAAFLAPYPSQSWTGRNWPTCCAA